jgi:50S ribosomal protein L16 3-hydroxylase
MKMALLGDRTVAQFLSRYWQKRPLVVRQALPGFKGLIPTSRLFRLATRDDVESRMVSRSNRWAVSHGPFTAAEVTGHPSRNWTLLVQGLNLHHAPADELLRRFSFIPHARLDDIMVSHAVPGGGVGPHTDSYDVFLLQAQGRRLWRIGPVPRPRFVPGLDLRILDGFEATEEYLMEPGDLLYLPPGWGHDGIALDECTTYSIGFRAPSRKELLSEFLVRMSERIELPGLYRDPDLKEQSSPASIPSGMVEQTLSLVSQLHFRTADVERFLGEYLSEPKPNVLFRRPQPVLAPSAFFRMAARHGVKLDLRTIMLHRGGRIFINGESLQSPRDSLALLRQLADRRELPPAGCQASSMRMIHEWYAAGWLHIRPAAASGK